MISKNLRYGWACTSIGEIFDIKGGGTPPTDNLAFWDGSTPWMTSADIHGLKNIRLRKKITREAIENSATNCVPKGSIIVVTRVGLGKVAVAPTDLCFSQDCQALINNWTYLVPEFCLYYLSEAVQIFKYKNRGTTISGVTVKQLRELEFPIPPLPEQHRIVARIEELFTQLDAGVASLMKVQAQLRRYRQAVLKAAFEGRLTQEWREEHKGEIEPAEKVLKSIESERITSKDRVLKDRKFTDGTELFDQGTGWIDVRIGDVVECLDHMRIPVNKEERAQRRGSIPYFGANGRVDWIDDFIFNEPLVLVVEDETFVGREIPFSYKITGKSWVNNHAHVLKPKTHVNIDFLNYSLMFYPFTKLTSGITGRRKLTKFALMNAPFKLPLIREQNQIVSEIERHFSQIDHLENTIITSLRQADSLRQSILKRAFEGKLVPQDPNDEPASVLLERIKAEKARHQTEAKKVMNTQRKPRSRRSAHAN
jgi:type I restriction enzyme S subunit